MTAMQSEDVACPYGDGTFASVGRWLQHVAAHLTEDTAADSPAARMVAAWQASTAAQTTAGRSSEILVRLLAVALESRGVIETVDTGATQAAADAQVAQQTADALAELAGTYESQLAASVEDRQALRVQIEELTARVEALETTPDGGTT